MAEDGYEYSPEALSGVSGALRRGAEALDGATTPEPTPPDAGRSSEAVGSALRDLLSSAVAGAQNLDEMAGKVDISRGSYDDVENTNAGHVRRESQEGLGEKNIPLN